MMLKVLFIRKIRAKQHLLTLLFTIFFGTIWAQLNKIYISPGFYCKFSHPTISQNTSIFTHDNSEIIYNSAMVYGKVENNKLNCFVGIKFEKVVFELGVTEENLYSASATTYTEIYKPTNLYYQRRFVQSTTLHCLNLPVRLLINLTNPDLKDEFGKVILGLNLITTYHNIFKKNGFLESRKQEFYLPNGELCVWEYGTILKKGVAISPHIGFKSYVYFRKLYLFDLSFLYQFNTIFDVGYGYNDIKVSDGTNYYSKSKLKSAGFTLLISREIHLNRRQP